ncbi:phospholipase D-like protein [Frondihabitans sp. PhB188]|uniref:PLD nuclease N-terminal domain-containing protein n=1 Tax=Frondihabitans sp. PhB188 TaxID=2485200 RepID=UPI000F48B7B9|nr:PLD nuclease N-terminal domain-containing protein [Frondihabitans sp. PhB188]ROQ39416.1 phospholipase D-like protein [Frondihabitans sp. PhB188]
MVKGLIVLIVAAAAFVVYALVDCLFTEHQRVRALPKPVWALIVIVLPVVGAVLWLLLGRAPRTPRRTVAPDDDPEFLGRPFTAVSDEDRHELDERIRRLEQELSEPPARTDDDGPSGTLK